MKREVRGGYRVIMWILLINILRIVVKSFYNKVSSVIVLLILLFVPFILLSINQSRPQPEILDRSISTVTETNKETSKSFFDVNQGIFIKILVVLFIITLVKYCMYKIAKMKKNYERKR